MNQSYFDNGDSIVVTDEKGKMTVRDNHDNVMKELQLENFSEYCDHYITELNLKSEDLRNRREKAKVMTKWTLGVALVSVPVCFLCSVLLSSSFAFSSFIVAAGIFYGGFILFDWKLAPKKKEIESIDKKIEFFSKMSKELEEEAKKDISKKKVREKEVKAQGSKPIYDVVPSEQLQDVEAVVNFIDKNSMSTAMLHDVAVAGDMQEELQNAGISPRQAELLTEYYSKVEVPEESTFAKAFYKEK